MPLRALALLALLLSVPALAGQPALFIQGPESGSAFTARADFYCQDPEFGLVYQMSSGFDAEIADDIPADLAGQIIRQITLWVGEWDAPWQDPLGIRVNFYNESCPPTLEPALSFDIPWSEWSIELVYSGIAEVYEATASLPEPVTIEAQMSLGVTALIDWGTAPPFTGFSVTPMQVSYGACVAQLDAANWGYDRWTPIDFFTTIVQDLGYCLGGTATAVAETPARAISLDVHPNPFNPRTELVFSLASAGSVKMRIFDLSGRCVKVLLDEQRGAGEHRITWNGSDASGRQLSSGVYCARLETGATVIDAKLVLIR